MLHLCYLLESTALSGGVRVVFDQARALRCRGHHASILARQGNHRWYPHDVDVRYVSDFRADALVAPPDVVIATFWTTVAPALDMPATRVVHFCQGCEWLFPEYESINAQIEQAYAHPIPKLTLGPWLAAQIRERFGNTRFPIACIGQIVDTRLHHPPPLWDRVVRRLPGAPRVLVVGVYESWVKGIAVALDAVAQVRQRDLDVRLVRVSTSPLSERERAHTRIDAYHHRLSPVALARLYRRADILLAPSRSPEGFGLPFAEALASGLPAIATCIPSFLSFDPTLDYALFVPEGDAPAMADGLRRVLQEDDLRRRLAQRGAEVVRREFDAEVVAQRIESTLMRWVAGEEA